MDHDETTCWTMIQGAAAGSEVERDRFARRYESAVRAYLVARWRGQPYYAAVDDAVQEVFVELFKEGGGLARAGPERPGGFRAFLYGITRHVALRVEERRARQREHPAPTDFSEADFGQYEVRLSAIFDRAWAKAMVNEAGARQADLAGAAGEGAERRVELLRLRFHEGLKIRDIARRWEVDPAALHREYARARKEFHEALLQVLAFHHPASPRELEQECVHLLGLLE